MGKAGKEGPVEEKRFRNKINWFTFFFSVLVIWVHSYNTVLFLGKTRIAYEVDALERFLGDQVAQIAVPGFFLISSYLFFRNFTLDRLWIKWNSRIRSVLVPYIVWNLLYYLGYVIGSRLPAMSGIIGKGRIPFRFTVAADAVLHYTYNYVFWYLNQLIVLILLAPVIYLIIRRRLTGVMLLTGILAAIYSGGALPLVNLDALFYYSFGAFAAVVERELAEQTWNRKSLLAGLAILAAGLLIKDLDLPGSIKGEVAATTVIFRLFIPVGLWLLVPEGLLGEAKDWMKQNFFLYAVHFAMVRLINKTGAFLLPAFPALPLGFFLLMPVLCVIFSYWAGLFLRRYLPVLWNLLNGGR